MSRKPIDDVVAHWHKLVENFSTSSQEFYTAVESALKRRRIPGLKIRRIVWNEGGVLSPKRDYLQMTDGRIAFDLCAAPFGTGFFFSWWLVKKPASWVALWALGFFAVADALKIGLDYAVGEIARLVPRWGLWGSWMFYKPQWLTSHAPWFWIALHLGLSVMGIVLWVVAVLMVFWLVAMLARSGWPAAETALLEVRIFGRAYQRVFAPVTYYRLDTAIMLQTAVHGAALEVIDGLTTGKGLRALTDGERKPIMRELLHARPPKTSRMPVGEMVETS